MSKPDPPAADAVPNPYYKDPTELTSRAVHAAVAQIRRDIAGQRDLFGARLDAIDTATVLHKEMATEIVNRGERQTAHLKELLIAKLADADRHNASERAVLMEKFKTIDQQFVERDVRTEQQAVAGAQALAAALQAAKELVGAQGEASAAAAVKSETSSTKQIDQITVIISTLEKALDSRITELKERIDRTEGARVGSAAAIGYIIAAITVFIAIVSVIFTVIVK